jgi:hypothetical protein
MTDDLPDPILILSVAKPDGTPIEAPLFAAVHVTQSLVTRLSKLSRLCKTHRLMWLATDHVDPPVFWDVAAHGLIDVTTTWHTVGDIHYAELSARSPLAGGSHSLAEVIGVTTMVDLSECEHLRAQGYVIDFRQHEGHEEAVGEPFASAVVRQMKASGLWPAHADLAASGLAPAGSC